MGIKDPKDSKILIRGLPQLDSVILIAAANSTPPWLTPAQKIKFK